MQSTMATNNASNMAWKSILQKFLSYQINVLGTIYWYCRWRHPSIRTLCKNAGNQHWRPTPNSMYILAFVAQKLKNNWMDSLEFPGISIWIHNPSFITDCVFIFCPPIWHFVVRQRATSARNCDSDHLESLSFKLKCLFVICVNMHTIRMGVWNPWRVYLTPRTYNICTQNIDLISRNNILVDVQCNHGHHTGQVSPTRWRIVSYSPPYDALPDRAR